MAYEYEFVEEEGYLLVVADGNADCYEDLLPFANAVFAEACFRDYRCILQDQRTVENSLTMHDAVMLAERFEAEDAPGLGVRAAIVSSPKNFETSKLFETAFKNRSMALRVFTDMKTAADWLQSKQCAHRRR